MLIFIAQHLQSSKGFCYDHESLPHNAVHKLRKIEVIDQIFVIIFLKQNFE
jgi:hypothetical protein